MRYLLNAFSLNMLCVDSQVTVRSLSPEVAGSLDLNELHSAVGHESTAAILGVKFNRESIKLMNGDTAVVAQYIGPRLEEGVKILPKGAKIEFKLITVENL